MNIDRHINQLKEMPVRHITSGWLAEMLEALKKDIEERDAGLESRIEKMESSHNLHHARFG